MNATVRGAAPWLLLAVAVVWGFAFPMQRIAGQSHGPFTVNAVRFFLALIALSPFVLPWRNRIATWQAAVLSFFLFSGSSLQQIGLMHTTAASAGFVTGTYVVFVPLISWLVYGDRVGAFVVLGVLLSFAGMSLLSFPSLASVNQGDLWVLASAIAFAAHTVSIGKIGRTSNPLHLAYGQYLFAFLACSIVAILVESSRGLNVAEVWGPFLYLGVISTAFGYTLQVVGQRFVSPTTAGIILSLESLFAAVGGFLILGEMLSMQSKVGCGLLLLGALVAQIPASSKLGAEAHYWSTDK